MKRLTLILALLVASPCFGQSFQQDPYIVQSTVGTSSCVFANDVTSGHSITIETFRRNIGGSGASSFTDTRTTTFNRVDTFISGTQIGDSELFVGALGSSGSETITWTTTAEKDAIVCTERNISVIGVDGATVHAGASNPTTPNLTTAVNGSLLVTSCFSVGAPTDSTNVFNGRYTSWAGGGSRLAGLAGVHTSHCFGGNQDIWMTGLQIASATAVTIISPAALPDAIQGVAYTYTMQAIGGAGAYTWSITSSALPTGLSINSSTGVISGTATNSALGAFNIHVTDGTHTGDLSTTLHVGASAATATHVQDSSGSGVFPGNVTSGNAVFIQYPSKTDMQSIPICTDTLGTAYKRFSSTEGNVNSQEYFVGLAPSTGADTVACNGSSVGLEASEFSGVDISADTFVFDTILVSSSISMTTSSLTTPAVNSLLFATYASNTGNVQASAPCNQIVGSADDFGSCYQIATTVTGYTETFTYNSISSTIGATTLFAFRPSSVGTAPGLGSTHPRVIGPY